MTPWFRELEGASIDGFKFDRATWDYVITQYKPGIWHSARIVREWHDWTRELRSANPSQKALAMLQTYKLEIAKKRLLR